MSRDSIAADVSRETFERLKIYAGLLEKWNPKINLVAKSTIPQLWNRHFLDSTQIFHLSGPFSHWVDLGSGGGFPGLVLAILAKEKLPDARFTLIESDQRKCAFLRTVVRETGLEATILAERIEDVAPLQADVISARALASLEILLGFADRHLSADGIGLFSKGARWKAEVAEAEAHWRFHWESVRSKTESEAVILKIGGIARVQS